MANFDRRGMTQAGINLMGKAIGGATIQFTKLVLGDGEMTGEILDLQGVVSPKQNVDVTRIERNDNQCTVGGELLTKSVKQGFFWRECGLYAMDPDQGEILYNYAYSSKPDYIAASDSGMMEEILVSMVATVGSNANVDISIDTSMVFTSIKEFNPLKKKVDELSVSVTEFGAKGDGVTDDTEAIQKAIDTGRKVFFPTPSNFYCVLGKLCLRDHTSLVGENIDVMLYNDTTNETLIEIIGTKEKYIKNISISNLTLRNGTATLSLPQDNNIKNTVSVKYVENLRMDNVKVTECEGLYGVRLKSVKNTLVTNCIFYRNTFSAFSVHSNCDGVTVDNCLFDTIVSTDTSKIGYRYLFATGNDEKDNPEDVYYCKNVKVINSRFLNNPLWEGIDTHGCENIWIENNYIENVAMGIMCGLAGDGYVTNPVHKNIVIRNNIIKKGNSVLPHNGIVVQGSVVRDRKLFAPVENVLIEGNKIYGFGDEDSKYIGSIMIDCSRGVVIRNNFIYDFIGHAINICNNNKNVTVDSNVIENGLSPITKETCAILCYTTHNIFITITNNKISSPKNLLRWGMRFNKPCLVRATDNVFVDCKENISAGGHGLVNVTTLGNLNLSYGNKNYYAYDPDGNKLYKCTSDNIRVHHLGTPDLNTRVNAIKGSNKLELIQGLDLGAYPDGLEIILEGAGPDGSNLNCIVTKNRCYEMEVSETISTTVTNLLIKTVPPVWEPVANAAQVNDLTTAFAQTTTMNIKSSLGL